MRFVLRRFENQVALVTGASAGIGRAVVRRLASEGARVVIAYRNDRDGAAELVGELSGTGVDAVALSADLTDEPAAMDLATRTLALFGKVDVLVNNAGAAGFAPLLDMRTETLDAMFDINVKAPLRLIQSLAPAMIAAGRGRIVNVASVAAMSTSITGTTPYAVAKAALVQLTKRAALELGSRGITVNAVCPGATRTAMFEKVSQTESGFGDAFGAAHPPNMLGRLAEPGEIAAAIAFLASDDASYITGQAITVDGGMLNLISRSG